MLCYDTGDVGNRETSTYNVPHNIADDEGDEGDEDWQEAHGLSGVPSCFSAVLSALSGSIWPVGLVADFCAPTPILSHPPVIVSLHTVRPKPASVDSVLADPSTDLSHREVRRRKKQNAWH